MASKHQGSGNPRPFLLIGFAPFDGAISNPSWEIAQALDGETIAGHPVLAMQLPVVFGESLKQLARAIRTIRPIGIIALGLASSRCSISLERVAINIDDARIPDNAGRQPIDQPVIRRAPAAYFSRLPIKAIHQALQQAGMASEISQSAGTYVCNHVFFGLMHRLRRQAAVPAGFIHVPPAAEALSANGVPLQQLIAAIRIAIAISLSRTSDLPIGGGAIC